MFGRTVITVLVSSVIALTSLSTAFAQFGYYFQGDWYPAEISPTHITIVGKKYDEHRRMDYECLDQLYVPERVGPRAALYRLEQGWDPVDALRMLWADSNIIVANPVLEPWVYIADEIIVRFNEGVRARTCEAIITKYGCEILEDDNGFWPSPFYGDGRRYYVKSTGVVEKNVLQTVKDLYENPQVDYACVNFYNNSKFDFWFLDNIGNADGSDRLDINDLVYMIRYVFDGGPAPLPHEMIGDADCSGSVDVADIGYMIAFFFQDGPEPGEDCDEQP